MMLRFATAQAYRSGRAIRNYSSSPQAQGAKMKTTTNGDFKSGFALGSWLTIGFVCYGIWDIARLARKYPLKPGETYESRRKHLKELDAKLISLGFFKDKDGRYVSC